MSPLSGYLHSFRMTNGCQRFHAASSPPRVAAASLGLNCEAAGEVAITSLNGERGIQFKPLSEVGSVLKGSSERFAPVSASEMKYCGERPATECGFLFPAPPTCVTRHNAAA